jgi:hypothetical protein
MAGLHFLDTGVALAIKRPDDRQKGISKGANLCFVDRTT